MVWVAVLDFHPLDTEKKAAQVGKSGLSFSVFFMSFRCVTHCTVDILIVHCVSRQLLSVL
jgi:hypothetical protein